MRPFYLWRLADPTGISGTGLIVEGILWGNGEVDCHWLTGTASSTHFKCIEDMEKIHCHGGMSKILWCPMTVTPTSRELAPPVEGIDEQTLNEMRERAAQATPGPWIWEDWDAMTLTAPPETDPLYDKNLFPDLRNRLIYDSDHEMSAADRDLIAHAREDIPLLLAEVVRLREK